MFLLDGSRLWNRHRSLSREKNKTSEHRPTPSARVKFRDAIDATRCPRTQVGKFAQLLQSIGRQRMSEVEQQGRRAVLVYY